MFNKYRMNFTFFYTFSAVCLNFSHVYACESFDKCPGSGFSKVVTSAWDMMPFKVRPFELNDVTNVSQKNNVEKFSANNEIAHLKRTGSHLDNSIVQAKRTKKQEIQCEENEEKYPGLTLLSDVASNIDSDSSDVASNIDSNSSIIHASESIDSFGFSDSADDLSIPLIKHIVKKKTQIKISKPEAYKIIENALKTDEFKDQLIKLNDISESMGVDYKYVSQYMVDKYGSLYEYNKKQNIENGGTGMVNKHVNRKKRSSSKGISNDSAFPRGSIEGKRKIHELLDKYLPECVKYNTGEGYKTVFKKIAEELGCTANLVQSYKYQEYPYTHIARGVCTEEEKKQVIEYANQGLSIVKMVEKMKKHFLDIKAVVNSRTKSVENLENTKSLKGSVPTKSVERFELEIDENTSPQNMMMNVCVNTDMN